jgi:hypothetical protein
MQRAIGTDSQPPTTNRPPQKKSGYMVVNASVKKLSGGKVQVCLRNSQHDPDHSQDYDSIAEARAVLSQLGVPQEALNFYFVQLLPWLEPNHKLEFPSMNIPVRELWRRGFRFEKTG